MNSVGSPEFRQECVNKMKQAGYSNLDRFYDRYLDGEDFDYAKLKTLGFCRFSSRNINAYINNPHDHYYSCALSWE